jgi:hypothetical protein
VLKLLLLSILLATFFLPAAAARVKDPRRAMISMLTTMLLAEIGYALMLYVVYPRFA